MLDHQDVWGAIDALASRKGLSPSALARRAGLDPTTFNKSKRYAPDGRPRWPSMESIAKILRATETSITDLFGGQRVQANGAATINVPLLGSAHAGIEDTAAAAEVPSPARIISFPDMRYEPMFALNVVGDSMLPLYRDGDILFISSSAPPAAGDRVVIKLVNGEVLVKVLQGFDGTFYDVIAVNPEHVNLRIAAHDVESIAKIVYASQ